eukprot:1445749-Rhodomonas_salina.3
MVVFRAVLALALLSCCTAFQVNYDLGTRVCYAMSGVDKADGACLAGEWVPRFTPGESGTLPAPLVLVLCCSRTTAGDFIQDVRVADAAG